MDLAMHGATTATPAKIFARNAYEYWQYYYPIDTNRWKQIETIDLPALYDHNLYQK